MEILNIEYNIGKLVLKALNKTKTIDDAAAALGVSTRHVYNFKKHYCIYWHAEKEAYMFAAKSLMRRFQKEKTNS